MATQSVIRMSIPDTRVWNGAGGTQVIDASGEIVGLVFRVPKTGNIDRIYFRTGAVTSSQTLRVGLQTVDAATGDPTGTAYGGMAVGTQASPAASTNYEITLGTPASATVGDEIAAAIEFDGAVGNLQIATINLASGFPYPTLFTGTWAKSNHVPMLAVRYDDGVYYDIGCFPPLAYNGTAAYNTGSTPDERALKFKLNFPGRLIGAQYIMTLAGTSSDYSVVLYDSNGTTVLQTLARDANRASGNTARLTEALFATSQALLKDTFYYLALKPTTANSITMTQSTFATAAVMDGFPGGQDFYLATRTDAGAWTDTATTRPHISLIFDGFDDRADGGPAGRPVVIQNIGTY